MPTKISAIKKSFHSLGRVGQDRLLSEIYGLSKETRNLLESRLLHFVDEATLIKEMEKETLDKVFNGFHPGLPNGKKVNSIIARAKKLNASERTLMDLERIAFEGFVEFLNEFGGGPESFEQMACDHLEKYLQLVRKVYTNEEDYLKQVSEIRKYIQKKNNMYVDGLWEIFEISTRLNER